jgi:hypothetical protein
VSAVLSAKKDGGSFEDYVLQLQDGIIKVDLHTIHHQLGSWTQSPSLS